MKQAFVITVVATGVLAAVLFMLPATPERSPDLLRTPKEAAQEAASRSIKDSLVDLGNARGTELYSPSNAETLIDGRPVSWPRYLLWCGEFAPDAADPTRFRVSDIRIAGNREPRTAADLDGLVRIPAGMPIPEIGAEMLRQVEAAALGLRAAQADLVGGRELETAERIELTKDVRLRFHDAADPKRRGELNAPSLTLHLDQGSVVRATTEESIRFESPEGTVTGAGFEGDPRSGAFTLLRDIEGLIANVGLLGLKGEPVTVSSKGPLRYEPAAPRTGAAPDPAAAKAVPADPLRAGGVVIVEGGVTIRQGESRIQGKKLCLRAGDTPVRVLHIVLEGDVEAHAPQGDFFGGILTYDGKAAGAATLTISGPGVHACWKNGARIFPGAARDGDLEIGTPGTITLAPVDAADEVPRKLEIGPGVVLSGPQIRAEGKTLVLDLVRVASNKEGTDPQKDSTVYPSRIVLDGGCRGESPEARFAGQTFIYSRTFGDDGRPVEDRVVLERDATLAYVLAAAPAEAEAEAGAGAGTKGQKTSSREESRALLSDPGSFAVAARDRIELVRDPARQRPIEARARGAVVVRRLGTGGEDDLLARVAAEEVDLTIAEVFVPVQRETGTRYVTRRSLARAAARGAVAFQVPGRLDGEGTSLDFVPATDDADFRGTDEKPARATFMDQDGAPQKVAAPRISFRGASKKLACEGRTDAELMLPPFMLDIPPGTPPVPTKIGAGALTVNFIEVEENGRRRLRAQDARASGSIEARQDGGGFVRAEKLRLDLLQKQAVLDGAPARIEMIRLIDGHPCREHIQSAHLTLLGEQALVDGPLEARLHATLGKMALQLDQKPAPEVLLPPDAPKPPPVPLDITAEGDLLLSRESILLGGPATVLQGEPKADGFRLDGRKVTLFLVPADALAAATAQGPTAPPPVSSSKALDVARAVVEGEVRYVSADLEAEGDVMEFDRITKRLILYGESGRSAFLTHRGLNLLRHPRPAHVLDFSDPAKPPFYESMDRPIR